jgi:hypothetical protein
VVSYRFGVDPGMEAITGVGTISTGAASDPDISPTAGFMAVVMEGFMVVAAMEGVIGKGAGKIVHFYYEPTERTHN